MKKIKIFCFGIPVCLNAIMILFCLMSLSSPLSSQPLANGHNKFLGNVIGYRTPSSFDKYWNQVTPENSGKWGSVEIGRDIYGWGGLDAAYNYAMGKNFPYKHHCLVWGQQQPGWIGSLDSAGQAEEVEEWIKLVGQRFPDMDFIDVVNEPLHAPPNYKNALGGDGVTGWDWVIWCFEKARKYCSDSTKLVLNEYSLLNDNNNTAQYLKIINLLKDRGLIDVIGIQGHYFELRSCSVSMIKSNLDKFAATGLPIHIAELDIEEADDNTQLQKYQEKFPALWEHPGVTGITFWGYIQGSIWKVNAYLIRSDGTERPALQWLRTYLSETNVLESTGSIPADYVLYQNYPNPFNPTTTIAYSLHKSSKVRINVFNTLGAKVRTLIDSFQDSGEHSMVWDAKDDQNNLVASGVYIYCLETDDMNFQRKMILVR